MGKVAGHLKKATYFLRKMAGKGLKVGGKAAQALGLASTVVAGLHPLVNPAAYLGKEVGSAIVKGIASFIPGVGGFISAGTDIAKKLADDELQAQVTDREFGGIGWGAVGTGMNYLGRFIEPADTQIKFKKIKFDSYQIDKIEDYERLYLYNKAATDTCMISYANSPIWKCSMSNSMVGKETTITIPNKGDLYFKFNFNIIGCKVGKGEVECVDQNKRQFFISFDKRQPKSSKILNGMAIEVKF